MNVPFRFAPVLLFAAAALQAQSTPPLTSVSLFKVSPGNINSFVEKGKAFAPALDKLMASGVITGYGIDVDILHDPAAQNVVFWVSAPNFAAVAKSNQAIDDFLKANPALAKEIYSLTDMATHSDLIVQSLETRQSQKPVPAGAVPVTDFDMVALKPGKTQEYLALFRKYDKPVLDKLVDDGTIMGYSFDTEAVHTMKPGMVWQIVLMPDLGTKDKVRAAEREAYMKLPEAERNMLDRMSEELTEPGSHRDSLSEGVFFKTK